MGAPAGEPPGRYRGGRMPCTVRRQSPHINRARPAMIPPGITDYLDRRGVPFVRRPHPTAVDGQHLAAALRTSGWRVAKSVLVDVDGRFYLFVLPAPERVSLERAAEVVGGSRARLADEEELSEVFADCEVGAEPPFGKLYGVKVVMAERLLAQPRLVVRAG